MNLTPLPRKFEALEPWLVPLLLLAAALLGLLVALLSSFAASAADGRSSCQLIGEMLTCDDGRQWQRVDRSTATVLKQAGGSLMISPPGGIEQGGWRGSFGDGIACESIGGNIHCDKEVMSEVVRTAKCKDARKVCF